MQKIKNKICFVLPEYASHTHFLYVVQVVESLAKETDVYVVVEKGRPEKSSARHIYVHKFSFMPLRCIESLILMIFIRARGYNKFYIHYSFLTAITASIVAKCSGGETFYWNAGLPWMYKRNIFREGFERLAYKLVSHLVTATETLKREYANHYGLRIDSICVIPNWIDVQAFTELGNFDKHAFRKSLKISPKAKVVLFLHRLSRRKGSHHILDIGKTVAADPDAIFLVVGDGPDREMLQKQAIEESLSDRIIFAGWIPNTEVNKYFAIADIFVMPSEEEGFPHVILEAMAAGLPFVAFDVGGMRDIIAGNLLRYVCAAEDMQSFTLRLSELLSSESLRREAGALGKELVKTYDKPTVLEKFFGLLIYS